MQQVNKVSHHLATMLMVFITLPITNQSCRVAGVLPRMVPRFSSLLMVFVLDGACIGDSGLCDDDNDDDLMCRAIGG
jgi:hypothetical protein